jgi:hypothetical protein
VFGRSSIGNRVTNAITTRSSQAAQRNSVLRVMSGMIIDHADVREGKPRHSQKRIYGTESGGVRGYCEGLAGGWIGMPCNSQFNRLPQGRPSSCEYSPRQSALSTKGATWRLTEAGLWATLPESSLGIAPAGNPPSRAQLRLGVDLLQSYCADQKAASAPERGFFHARSIQRTPSR